MRSYQSAKLGFIITLVIETLVVTAVGIALHSGASGELVYILFYIVPLLAIDYTLITLFLITKQRWVVWVEAVLVGLRCVFSFGLGLVLWGLPFVLFVKSLRSTRGSPASTNLAQLP